MLRRRWRLTARAGQAAAAVGAEQRHTAPSAARRRCHPLAQRHQRPGREGGRDQQLDGPAHAKRGRETALERRRCTRRRHAPTPRACAALPCPRRPQRRHRASVLPLPPPRAPGTSSGDPRPAPRRPAGACDPATAALDQARPAQRRPGGAHNPHRRAILDSVQERGDLDRRPAALVRVGRDARQITAADARQAQLVPALAPTGQSLGPGDAPSGGQRRDQAQRLARRLGAFQHRRAGDPEAPASGAQAHASPLHSGSVTVKRVPAPTALRTSIDPPCASVNSRAIASPRPAPGSGRSAWKNSSKMNGRSASAMPRPASSTATWRPSPIRRSAHRHRRSREGHI